MKKDQEGVLGQSPENLRQIRKDTEEHPDNALEVDLPTVQESTVSIDSLITLVLSQSNANEAQQQLDTLIVQHMLSHPSLQESIQTVGKEEGKPIQILDIWISLPVKTDTADQQERASIRLERELRKDNQDGDKPERYNASLMTEYRAILTPPHPLPIPSELLPALLSKELDFWTTKLANLIRWHAGIPWQPSRTGTPYADSLPELAQNAKENVRLGIALGAPAAWQSIMREVIRRLDIIELNTALEAADTIDQLRAVATSLVTHAVEGLTLEERDWYQERKAQKLKEIYAGILQNMSGKGSYFDKEQFSQYLAEAEIMRFSPSELRQFRLSYAERVRSQILSNLEGAISSDQMSYSEDAAVTRAEENARLSSFTFWIKAAADDIALPPEELEAFQQRFAAGKRVRAEARAETILLHPLEKRIGSGECIVDREWSELSTRLESMNLEPQSLETLRAKIVDLQRKNRGLAP